MPSAGSVIFATDFVEWTNWSPTLSNLTLGSGTRVARYFTVFKLFFFEFDFTLGAGSAVGSGPAISMPPGLTLAARYTDLIQPIGFGQCYDSSAPTGSMPAIATIGSSGSQINFYYLNGNNNPGSVASTTPFTWATGDHLYVRGTAELA